MLSIDINKVCIDYADQTDNKRPVIQHDKKHLNGAIETIL